MPTIRFKTELFAIRGWTIMLLPQSASAKLPSRGQVMVKATINDFEFQAALEPDGAGSHWLNLNAAMQKSQGVRAGDTVEVTIEPIKAWPEPTIPEDVQKALDADPKVQKLWESFTPMARHEWLRWINSTAQPETRKKRIAVSCSKMLNGWRRPCCFNRNMCCVPEVSKSGVLLASR